MSLGKNLKLRVVSNNGGSALFLYEENIRKMWKWAGSMYLSVLAFCNSVGL